MQSHSARAHRRVLILADESADWKVAGLRQLDRLALSLNEWAQSTRWGGPISVCVFWNAHTPPSAQWLPQDARLEAIELTVSVEELLRDEPSVDLVLSTRVFLYRNSLPELIGHLPAPVMVKSGAPSWQSLEQKFRTTFPSRADQRSRQTWKYLSNREDIPTCEKSFLRHNGKSQDGLVSRYLNRRISRWLSGWLLKLPVVPSTWSALIFTLPVAASWAFLQGTYSGFVAGCAIFQLYSILDGCDGEIARAKFLQTEFGRRLDSLCDLTGNIMLALSLGIGLTRQIGGFAADWFYVGEGIAAAILIATSEGIVFVRRSRTGSGAGSSGRWNGMLYQRHHEFLERSGILVLGERVAWWLVQLTKRDMAMLAFLVLAIAGWPAGVLHLLFAVAAMSSLLAANAFLRQPAPAVAQEAS